MYKVSSVFGQFAGDITFMVFLRFSDVPLKRVQVGPKVRMVSPIKSLYNPLTYIIEIYLIQAMLKAVDDGVDVLSMSVVEDTIAWFV